MTRPNLIRLGALVATTAFLLAALPSAAATLAVLPRGGTTISTAMHLDNSCNSRTYQSGSGYVDFIEAGTSYYYDATGQWTNGCGGKACDDHVSARVVTRSGDYEFVAQEYGTASSCHVRCSIFQDVISSDPSEVTGDSTSASIHSVDPQKSNGEYVVYFSCTSFYTLPNGHVLSFNGYLGGGRPAVDTPDVDVPEIAGDPIYVRTG